MEVPLMGGYVERLIARLEGIFWEQKSRKTRLKDGNNNTKFFHRLANLHK